MSDARFLPQGSQPNSVCGHSRTMSKLPKRHMIPLTSLHRMELCVGMICGTIPALRPLLAQTAKTPRFEIWYKLTPVGHKPLSGLNSASTTPPRFSRSTSHKIIMATNDLKQIPRTSDVKTNNEAVGVWMKEGRAIGMIGTLCKRYVIVKQNFQRRRKQPRRQPFKEYLRDGYSKGCSCSIEDLHSSRVCSYNSMSTATALRKDSRP